MTVGAILRCVITREENVHDPSLHTFQFSYVSMDVF
jgi:hypothetical protein